MCATDCGSQCPGVRSAFVNVVNEDLLETIFTVTSEAAMLGIGHQSCVLTRSLVCSVEFESVTEAFGERSFSECVF